jgi:hypothetical protein
MENYEWQAHWTPHCSNMEYTPYNFYGQAYLVLGFSALLLLVRKVNEVKYYLS